LTGPSTRRWRAAKADTIWIAVFPFLLSADLRDVLPSMATISGETPVMLATQATKHRWNIGRVKRREDVAELIMRRGPILERQEEN
jgi:hypothetical protein